MHDIVRILVNPVSTVAPQQNCTPQKIRQSVHRIQQWFYSENYHKKLRKRFHIINYSEQNATKAPSAKNCMKQNKGRKQYTAPVPVQKTDINHTS